MRLEPFSFWCNVFGAWKSVFGQTTLIAPQKSVIHPSLRPASVELRLPPAL